jgi:hypothetical protein
MKVVVGVIVSISDPVERLDVWQGTNSIQGDDGSRLLCEWRWRLALAIQGMFAGSPSLGRFGIERRDGPLEA